MMVRTQITLEAEHHARAKARAAELGIAFAKYMRRLVDRDLSESGSSTDPSLVFDLGTSGGTDIASDKDRMLGQAVAAAKQPRGSHPQELS